MYTYCPDCSSVYEISTEELGAAAGLVRCGNCDATFSALRRLTDTPPVLPPSTELPSNTGQAHLDFSSATEHNEQQLKELGMEETANGEHDLIFPTFEDESYPENEEPAEPTEQAAGTANIDADGDSEEPEDAGSDHPPTVEDQEPADQTADTTDIDADGDSEEPEDAGSDHPPTPEDQEPADQTADTTDIDADGDSEELDEVASDTPSTAEDEMPTAGKPETSGTADLDADGDAEDSDDAASDAPSSTDDDADDIENETVSEERTETGNQEAIAESAAAPEHPPEDDAEMAADTVDDQEEDLFDELIHDIDELAELEALIDTGAGQDGLETATGASDADGEDRAMPDTATDTLEDWDTEEGEQDLEELLADTALLDEGAVSDTDDSVHEPDDDADSDPKQALEGEPSPPGDADAGATEPADGADPATAAAPEHNDQSADILTADVDGKFEAGTETDDEHDYRDLRHYLKPGKSLARRVGEVMLLLLLVALLGAQFIHHNRAMLATHPEFGGPLQSTYKALGLDLHIDWRADDYRVARHTIVPDDNNRQNLMARATIVNNSPQARPLPMVRLELRNRWGDPIFARIFTADEYLQMPAPEQLAGNGRVEVALDIRNPTDDVEIGYSFDVCVAIAGGGADCGTAAVFREN